MEKYYYILLVNLLCGISLSFSQPKIGEPMPCVAPDTIQYGIASAQTARGCNYFCNGVKYFVATIDNSHISYISTSDSLFKTPEGIRVGSTYRDVLLSGGSVMNGEISWAYYSELPSGWCAQYSGIPGIDSIAGIALKQDSVVHKLFKRH